MLESPALNRSAFRVGGRAQRSPSPGWWQIESWCCRRRSDASIKPGDDFFAYANGGWLKATAIPAGKERWGARDELEELTRRRIAKLLDDAGAAPAGSAARKVADFRAAYLNEAAIEARGPRAAQAAARSHREGFRQGGADPACWAAGCAPTSTR